MASPSQVPQRLPAGSTTDAPFQPFADSGYSNPAFYHQFFDDFDNQLGASGLYTQSGTGETIAHVAGDGGLGQISIAATSGDWGSIQLPAADFLLPQTFTAGKKLFYGTRIAVSSLTTNFIAGLCDTTTTPFSAISDGVYFQHPTGGSVINLITASASTVLTWTIPTSAYQTYLTVGTLSGTTPAGIDLAFYIDRYANINVFIATWYVTAGVLYGETLFGFVPQSGSGATLSTSGVSINPNIGRCLQIPSQVTYGAESPAPGQALWTVSSATLNPTLGIQTESATAVTLQADFHIAQKER